LGRGSQPRSLADQSLSPLLQADVGESDCSYREYRLSLAKGRAVDDYDFVPVRRGLPIELTSGVGGSIQAQTSQRFAHVVSRLERRRSGHSPLIVVSKVVLAAPTQIRDRFPLVNCHQFAAHPHPVL
jgi:hypothetical protein